MILYEFLFFLSRNSTHIIARAPQFAPNTGTGQFMSQSFDVNLLYTPSYSVDVTEPFTYLPDPVIDDVLDLSTIQT